MGGLEDVYGRDELLAADPLDQPLASIAHQRRDLHQHHLLLTLPVASLQIRGNIEAYMGLLPMWWFIEIPIKSKNTTSSNVVKEYRIMPMSSKNTTLHVHISMSSLNTT